MDCYLRIVPAHGVVPFLGMLLLVCIVCWWYVSYRHSRCDKFIGLGSGLVIDLQIYIAQSSRSEQVKAAIFDSTLIFKRQTYSMDGILYVIYKTTDQRWQLNTIEVS